MIEQPKEDISIQITSLNLVDAEQVIIAYALKLRLSLTGTAKLLGLTRDSLRRRIARYGLSRHRLPPFGNAETPNDNG